MLSARSASPYRSDIPMHPSPSADTRGPAVPSCRVIIIPSLPSPDGRVGAAPPSVDPGAGLVNGDKDRQLWYPM